ncbi:hypothetical protein [Empedobacter falsenii]|uniref:Oligosaccharide repeat unit polymerase n=1 Tax=Empedobacter falsenii TaxID=343874 RepID=A0A3R8TRC3_9FLAO|nr:hypothetical protein [Empedobacter falsenii]RRT93465.1 hypothetical protein EGI89_03410 [Empedobacter falsenii]RRT93611.1 hypothetical protein EGI88_03420 [Empedobacter falsenii]
MKFLKLTRVVLLIVLLLLFILYGFTTTSDNFSYVFLVPVVFIFTLFLETKFFKKYTLMLYILLVLSLVKYYIIPLLIIFSNNIKAVGPLPSLYNFKYAILITIIEILTLYIVKYLFFKKNTKNNINNTFKYVRHYTKNNNLKFLIIALLLLFFFLFNQSLLLPKNIFAERDYYEDGGVKSSLSIVVKWIIVIAFPIFVIFIKQYFKTTGYYLNLLFFLLFGYLQLGTSRWTILFYTIIAFAFLLKVYGNKVKKVIFPVSGLLLFVMLSISIYKFSWAVNDSSNKYIDIVIVMSEQLQSYFSGPTLIAQSLEIENNYKIGISTLINDFAGSIPLVSSSVDQGNRINYIFNEYIFGANTIIQTQIMPMSGIGYVYFGLLGSTIFVFIYTYIGLKLENLANQSKDIINFWILTYMAIWCIASIIFSSQLIWGNIIANYAILLGANFIINQFNLKK